MYYQYPAYRNTTTDNRKMNVIRVTGEGRVSIQPNKAEVTLGVATEDKELMPAQQNNAEAIAKIIEGIKERGVADEQIQTFDYSIFPQYDFVEGQQIFRGYKVQHLLLITVEKIENVGMIIDNAVSNGANLVTNIKFTSTATLEAEKQALSLAVIHAYQKAETVAGTLGVQLVKAPILVAENSRQQDQPIPFQTTAFVKSEAATAIQPGTLEIVSFVTVEFVYS